MSESAKKTETAGARMSKAIRSVGREAKDVDGTNITLNTELKGAGQVTQSLEAIKNRQKDLDRSKITLSTSLKGAKESIGELTQLEGVSTRIDGDTVTLTAEVDGTEEGRTALQSLQQAASRIDGDDIRMKAEVVGAPQAVGELAELNREADRVDGRNVRLNVDRSSVGVLNALGDALTTVATRMRALQTVSVAAVVPGLVAAIGAIPAIVTPAVAALGALATGIGAGLAGASAVGVGALGTFAGAVGLIATPVTMVIGKLEEYHKGLEKSSAKSKTAASAAGSLADAERNAAKAADAVGEARISALEGVTAAENAYEDSLDVVVEREKDVEQARGELRDATTDLTFAQRDFNDAIEDEPLNQAEATLDLADARDRASDALTEYNEQVEEHGRNSEEATDALRRLQRANLDLERTDREVGRTRARTSDEFQSAAKREIAARKGVASAAEGLQSAEQAVTEAREDSQRKFEAIAKAQTEGQRQINQALAAQEEANLAVARAADKLAEAERGVLDEIIPLTAAQKLLYDEFMRFKEFAGGIFTPAMDEAARLGVEILDLGRVALPSVGRASLATMQAVTRAFRTIRAELMQPVEQAGFARFLATIPRFTEVAAVAVGRLGIAFFNLFVRTLPYVMDLAHWLGELGTGALAFTRSAAGIQKVDSWLAYSVMRAKELFAAIGNLTLGFFGLFAAFEQAGLVDQVWGGFVRLTKQFREFTAAGTEGRQSIISFSNAAQPILTALWGLVESLVIQWFRVANAVMRMRDEMGKLVLPQVFKDLQEALVIIGDLLIEAFRNFGPYIGPIIIGLAEFLKYAIALNPVLHNITQGFAWLLTKFRELSPEMKTAIASAASLRIAFAIAIPVIAALLSPLTRIVGGFGLLATKAGVIGGILAPGGAVLIGLGLVAGALGLAYIKNEEFRKSINGMGEKIKEAFSGVKDAVVDIFDLEEKDKAKIESHGRNTGGAFIAGSKKQIREEMAAQGEGTPSYELGFKMGKALQDGFKNATGPEDFKANLRQRLSGILADLNIPGFRQGGQSLASQFLEGFRQGLPPGTLRTMLINRLTQQMPNAGFRKGGQSLAGSLIAGFRQNFQNAGFRKDGESLATRLIAGFRARIKNAGFRKDGESLATRFWNGVKARWTQGQNQTQASDVTWREKLGSKWNSFTAWAGQKWGTFWGGVKRRFSEGQNTTQTGDVTWREKLGSKWNSFTAWASGKWSGFWGSVKRSFKGGQDTSQRGDVSWREKLGSKWNSFIAWAEEKWSGFWASVKRFFKGGQDDTVRGDVSWRERLGSKWNSFTAWASQKWKTFWGGVKSHFKGGQDDTVQSDATWREKLGSKWNSFTAWALEKWRTWKEDLKTAFRNLRDDTRPIFEDMGRNIWEPLEAAWNTLKGIFNSILEGMAKVAGAVGLDGVAEKLRGVKFSTGQTSQGDRAPVMMARGGVVRRGGMANAPTVLYGEAGPEAYVRLDKRTPQSQEAARAVMASPNAPMPYDILRGNNAPAMAEGGLLGRTDDNGAGAGMYGPTDNTLWSPDVFGRVLEVLERFRVSANTYTNHPPSPDRSADFWDYSGRGTPISVDLNNKVRSFIESSLSTGLSYILSEGDDFVHSGSNRHVHVTWGGADPNVPDVPFKSVGPQNVGGGILQSLWETVGNAYWNRLVQKPWDNFKADHVENKGVPTQILGGIGDTLLKAIKEKFISEGGSSAGALPGGASPSGLTLAEAVAKGGWPEHLQKTAVGVAWEESSANARAQNPSGARGLFQIMPGTASDVGADYEKLYDPIYNSAAGRKVYDLQGWGAWVAHPPSYESMSRGNTPITGYAKGGIDRPHRGGSRGWRLDARTSKAFRTVAETLARFAGGSPSPNLPIGDKGGVGWGQIRAITDEAGPEAIIPLSQRTPEGESALAAAMKRYGIKAMQYGGTLGWGLVKHFEDGSEGIGINPQTKYASLVEQAIRAWDGLGILTMKRGSFYGDSVPVYDDYNLGSSTLGRAYSDGKIALNPTLLDRYPASRILSTISHELGHIVDLAHYSGGGLMHTPSYEGRPSLPGSTERTNLARIYGPPERGVEEHDPPSSGGTTGGTGGTQTNRSSTNITSSGGGSSYIVTHNGKVVASSGSAQGGAGRVAGSGVINRGAINRPMSGMTHVNVQATDPELRKQMEKMENTLNTTLKRQEQKMIQARELAREIIRGTKHTIGSGAADRELDHIISEALS